MFNIVLNEYKILFCDSELVKKINEKVELLNITAKMLGFAVDCSNYDGLRGIYLDIIFDASRDMYLSIFFGYAKDNYYDEMRLKYVCLEINGSDLVRAYIYNDDKKQIPELLDEAYRMLIEEGGKE